MGYLVLVVVLVSLRGLQTILVRHSWCTAVSCLVRTNDSIQQPQGDNERRPIGHLPDYRAAALSADQQAPDSCVFAAAGAVHCVRWTAAQLSN
jgi:hypothetical protein